MLNYLSGVSLSVMGPRWFRRVPWAGHGVSMAFEILTDDSNLVMSEMELHWSLVHWSGLFFFCFLIVTVEAHQSVHPVQFSQSKQKSTQPPSRKESVDKHTSQLAPHQNFVWIPTEPRRTIPPQDTRYHSTQPNTRGWNPPPPPTPPPPPPNPTTMNSTHPSPPPRRLAPPSNPRAPPPTSTSQARTPHPHPHHHPLNPIPLFHSTHPLPRSRSTSKSKPPPPSSTTA